MRSSLEGAEARPTFQSMILDVFQLFLMQRLMRVPLRLCI